MPLSEQARRQLVMFAGLVPLVQVNVGRRWDPIRTATDASEFGYGSCYTELGADLASDMGRCSER